MINLPGKEAAPTFESPLDMLHACHDRIEIHCTTLEKLVEYLPRHGCDSAARQTAANILRYFDTAGPNHHADEERDLFPLLRAGSHGPEAVELAALLESLIAEHRLMEQAWQQDDEVAAPPFAEHCFSLADLWVPSAQDAQSR